MTHDEERHYRQMVESVVSSVKKIEEALLGTLTDPNGALQSLTRFMNDVYRPDDPSQNLFKRVRAIEDKEQWRSGWIAAAGTFGGLIGGAIVWALNYIFGK